MTHLYLKMAHIVFVVTWFSGLFYLCRLYVYQREASEKESPEKEILLAQFQIMCKRLLYGITWPSAILTLILGIGLIYSLNGVPDWLLIKLGFVLILYAYHFSLQYIFHLHSHSTFNYSSVKLRLWNEVPTLLLVAIVSLAVVKQDLSWAYGIVGLVALTVLLYGGIRVYKLLRKQE